MRRLALCLLLMSFAAASCMAAPLSNISRKVVEPTVGVNADPVCGELIDLVRAAFREEKPSLMSGLPLPALGGLTAMSEDELGKFEANRALAPNGWHVDGYDLSTSAAPLFVFMSGVAGCGGGCERVAAFIADNRDGKNAQATDQLMYWTIYKRGGARFMVGADYHRLVVHRLDHAPAPVSCQIDLTISREILRSRAEIAAITPVLDEFANAIDAIRRPGGDCGSLNTAGRLSGQMRDSFDTLLYRPWAVAAFDDREPDFFEPWALQGVSEFDAWHKEQQTFALARKALAEFYAAQFGLAAHESDVLAGRTLRGAEGAGFSYTPDDLKPLPSDDDAYLRRAILEHRPLAELPIQAVSRSILDGGILRESILNVAVRYPEALALLLEAGADPNIANQFGKTPLMYAAQHDHIDSVKLLIDAGAYVNATTVDPVESCYYSLGTLGATPLHYAARYAHAEVVRLLIRSGAFTFNRASWHDPYPLDWFEMQGDADLNRQQRDALAAELTPSDDATRARLAEALSQRGARMIRARKYEAAYQAMRDADRARPGSSPPTPHATRVDFSLIALRSGHIIESLESSESMIKDAIDPELRAAAWFNAGLACERAEAAQVILGFKYCSRHRLLDFLNAWQESPNPAREHKVDAVLATMTPFCEADPGTGSEQYFLVIAANGQLDPMQSPQRIIVRHPRRAPPIGDVVEIPYQLNGTTTQVRAQLDRRVDLRDYSLTLLSAPVWIQGTVKIRGHGCTIN